MSNSLLNNLTNIYHVNNSNSINNLLQKNIKGKLSRKTLNNSDKKKKFVERKETIKKNSNFEDKIEQIHLNNHHQIHKYEEIIE